MSDLVTQEYRNWLRELKQQFRQAQIKASVKVNSTLLEFYWKLGADIVDKQKSTTWGSGFLDQLSRDLMSEFRETKGFSKNNLQYIRRWYLFYNSDQANVEQAVTHLEKGLRAKLFQIPWEFQNIS
jgi:predicted nuclease of restriction endonuclease-like (RecB) superfamily